jgi:hypothetical protein
MKMIKYTLNSDGTIPDYVTDGGYLAKWNGNASPKDYDLIGIATDAAPQTGYVNEAALLQYAQDNNFTFTDPMTDEEIPLENVISSIWSKLG